MATDSLEATAMLAASIAIDGGGSVIADDIDVKENEWDNIWDNPE